MAVTTGTAAMRQQSLQCSLMYLQQEHAKTLQGLHDEIHHLQKRCSDLTFQLAMHATSIPEEENTTHKAHLEAELEKVRKELAEKEDILEKKDRRVRLLEQQLKAQEKKFTDEARSQRVLVAQLRGELDSKAGMIAHLTTQLHGLRVKTRGSVDAQTKRSVEEGEHTPVTPVPPREGAPRHRRRLSSRISIDGPILPSAVKIHPPSTRKLPARPDSADLMLDPTPFLRHDSSDKIQRSERTVLPPIGNRPGSRGSTSSSSPVPATEAIVPQSTHSFTFVQKHKRNAERAPSSSPEVEVLAVDQVVRRDHSLRRAHEYNSAD